MSEQAVRVYVLVAHTPARDPAELYAFANRLGRDALPPLEEATGMPWRFHAGEPYRLESDDARYPSDFLREAHLRMVEAPTDVVLVITNATLLSRAERLAPGLASPEARVIVLSTRNLRVTRFGDVGRALDAEAVRWNAATLLVHLFGHLLGLGHEQNGVMAPFSFDERRRNVPPFDPDALGRLVHAVARFAEPDIQTPGPWARLKAHIVAAARHPRAVFAPALRSRAPLLPLRLTKMLAAAVVPTFVLLFTDEFWWIGIELAPGRLWFAAAVAIMIGAWYIPSSQRLFFPHREKRLVTEHIALVNVAILVSSFFLVAGLFTTVVLLILLVQWSLFPAEYIGEWFQDRSFAVGWRDRIRLAVVVSILGTLTGALGGGFHGRGIIRRLALFLKTP